MSGGIIRYYLWMVGYEADGGGRGSLSCLQGLPTLCRKNDEGETHPSLLKILRSPRFFFFAYRFIRNMQCSLCPQGLDRVEV